jgi:ABC-type multidrug transport system fused ATPase/permease subunit
MISRCFFVYFIICTKHMFVCWGSQTFIDIMIFGTIIYWMIGLAPTVHNYFIYIAILFIFSLVMNQMLSIWAAIAKTKTGVQGFSSCILFLQVLTCGFIVTPDCIPAYYKWIYWWSPLAWTYRALLVNEFTSSGYDTIVEGTDQTIGDSILIGLGFTDIEGNAFGEDWIGYAFASMAPYLSLCVIITGLCLKYIRVETVSNESTLSESQDDAVSLNGEEKNGETVNLTHEHSLTIPFKPVTLSFEDVCYDVSASKGETTLRLLNHVDGIFEHGKMCALMGSSGSGKTTLMVSLAYDTGFAA